MDDNRHDLNLGQEYSQLDLIEALGVQLLGDALLRKLGVGCDGQINKIDFLKQEYELRPDKRKHFRRVRLAFEALARAGRKLAAGVVAGHTQGP